MVLILKHKKFRHTGKVKFLQGGWTIQYGGYLDATSLKDWQKEKLLKRMGFSEVEASSVPSRYLKSMKINLEELTSKPCQTSGCDNRFPMENKVGMHFRKYCDDCQKERAA